MEFIIENSFLFILPIAYILDLLFGDPVWIPHPIIGFGKIIHHGDKILNRNTKRKLKGLIIVIILTTTTYISFFIIDFILFEFNILTWMVFNILFAFLGLANKTLINEGRMVFKELYNNGLKAGQRQVGRIVGRNTAELNEHQIKKATLETLSENLSDGVVAPLFYFAIGGIPAMMLYKMINTMDSMVGYKNEKYKDFGFFPAKLDDVANYIPARITAFLISFVSFSGRSFHFIFKYGKAHASPNAGYPEAALAGVLNCQFGGPAIYGNIKINKPYIGNNVREIENKDLIKTVRVNHLVCFVSVFIIIGIKWMTA